MNCQIRGLTSIRKGLGQDHIHFLVNTDSIIASENVSGGVQVENQGSRGKVILTKLEGSQSGGVQIFPNTDGSQSGGVLLMLIRRGLHFANPEGSYFCQSRGVLFFVNPEGFYFCLRT